MTTDFDDDIILPAPISEILNEQDKWDYITAAVERGIQFDFSQYRIRNVLRGAGLRFSNTVMSGLYSVLKYGYNQFSLPTRLPMDITPDIDTLAEAPYNMTYKYGYIGAFDYTDTEGKLYTKTYRYETDRLLTKRQAIQELEEMVWAITPKPNETVTNFTYSGMVVRTD